MVWPGVSSTCSRSPREFKSVSILHRDRMRIRPGRAAPRWMVGPATVAQFQVAGDKVGMEMREKNMLDLESELFRVVQVLLDVALRIDDDRPWSWPRLR